MTKHANSSTPSPENDKAIEHVAYHEAGHAVMAHFLRISFNSVTIKPNEDYYGWMEGRARITQEDDFGPSPSEAWIKKSIIVSCAGKEAELLVSKQCDHEGAEGDNENIFLLLSIICGDSDHFQETYSELQRQTTDFMARPEVRRCLDAVVKALLARETLNRKEVGAIIREALGDTPAPHIAIRNQRRRKTKKEIRLAESEFEAWVAQGLNNNKT